MSAIKLPELPPVPPKQSNYDGGDDYWTESDFERYATAYAEQAVREALESAAQSLEPMAQEAFERPGVAGTVHMAYHQAIQIIRALVPEKDHGEST